MIRGTAVPWNVVGTVSDGTRVRFAAGSLEATSRPIVTLGHDGPPIGRTVANVAGDTGMETAVRVSRVRDGDDALVLAADGVLGMFSVGVESDSSSTTTTKASCAWTVATGITLRCCRSARSLTRW